MTNKELAKHIQMNSKIYSLDDLPLWEEALNEAEKRGMERAAEMVLKDDDFTVPKEVNDLYIEIRKAAKEL